LKQKAALTNGWTVIGKTPCPSFGLYRKKAGVPRWFSSEMNGKMRFMTM